MGIATVSLMRFNPTDGTRRQFHAADNKESEHGNITISGAIMTAPGTVSDLKDTVLAGEKIYAEKYKSEYEAKYSDQFAAIDVTTGAAFVGAYPEEALERATEMLKGAVLHLVRIGSPSAFQVSYFSSPDGDLGRLV